MATEITINGTLILDQSSGVQSGLDGNDDAIDSGLNGLSAPFQSFLLAQGLSTDQLNFADDVEAAISDSDLVTVSADGAEIDALFFSDANGDPLDGDQVFQSDGVTPLTTIDGDNIYLHSYEGGSIVLATTSATAGSGEIVAAFYLDAAADYLSAGIETVTFIALAHPDDTDPDDRVDWTDVLNISATGSLDFNFDNLESGKFLWVAVGSESNGLLVTGKDLNVQDPGHAKEGDRVNGGSDPSDAMNTSQGGEGATIGVNNQMFDDGNTGVFTLVEGFDPLASTADATGDNVKEIDYDGYTNVEGAEIFISQTQGGGDVNLTIDVFEAGGGATPEESFGYIGAEGGNNGTSGAFEDDTDVPVATVTVLGVGDIPVGTWGDGGSASGTTIAGVTITINGNSIIVDGITAGYTVQWTVADGETFNRFHVTANTGTEAFDVGRVSIAEGVTVTTPVGDKLHVDDDGPTVDLTADGAAVLVVDESLGENSGEDETGSLGSVTISVADYLTTNDGDAGTDGGQSDVFSFDDPGPNAASGLTDTLSGEAVVLNLEVGTGDIVGTTAVGGDEVVRWSIDPDTGEVTLTQERAIVHDDTDDHDESASPAVLGFADLIVVRRTIVDNDDDEASDTVDLSGIFKFEDDGPALDIALKDGATVALDETADDGDEPALNPNNYLAQGTIAAAALFDTTTEEGGSDGQDTAATSYAFVDPGTDVDSGLVDSQSGEAVLYNLDGGDIVGTTALGGLEVIRYQIDAATGEVTASQSRAVVHPDITSDDETLAHSFANLIVVEKTIFDNDGDSASDQVDITSVFKIDDDGPALDIALKDGATVALDETAGDGDEPAPNPNNYLAQGTIAAAALFDTTTEEGGSDGQDTAATSYAFVDPGTDVDSGLVDSQSGEAVVYNLDGGDIVGTTALGGLEVIRYQIDAATGEVTASQSRAVVHPDITSDDETLAHSFANLIVVEKTIFDNDGDSASDQVDITSVFEIDDDGPALDIALKDGATVALDETADDGDEPALNPNNYLAQGTIAAADLFDTTTEEGGSDGQDTAATSYAFVDPGTDVDSGLVDSQSGEAVLYNLDGGDIVGTTALGGLEVIRYQIDAATGEVTASQSRAVVHPDITSDDETLAHSFANLIVVEKTIFDNDGDSASDQVDITSVFEIDDDGPEIIDQILGGTIPFAAGQFVTNSLNGDVGSDENDANDETADGTKTYTFDTWSTPVNAIANLESELIEDGTRVVYFTDDDAIDGFSAGDALFFDNVLSQDGSGDYTFTVYQTPPPALLEFDFADLPSGQNLHGTIAADKTDPDGLGLLLFPKGALLKTDGTFTNASPTTNTSKGGGPVTIGNTNQMIDPNEGHFFVYVDDPKDASIAGITGGLDQNSADDADTIGFQDTLAVGTAQVEIVQVQGGGLASLKLSAYDITLASAVDTDAEARDFVTNPLTAPTPQSVTQVDIIRVKVFDANGNVIEDSDLGGVQDPNVTINFDGPTAVVSGLNDDYSVEFTTAVDHDMALVEGVSGKFDIGGFNLIEAQPTPDQEFDFAVNVTDYDGDTDGGETDPFANFSILVEGTEIV